MVDVTTLVLLAASFFFVALSVALLVRYRQVSERINASTDMGRDLWSALEQRLKKQDERILDMMGRFEVVQSRVMAASVALAATGPSSPAAVPSASLQRNVAQPASHITTPSVQQPESRQLEPEPPELGGLLPITQATKTGAEIDETQLAALKLLGEAAKNTRQLTDALGKSREHTARIMKALFEAGLVVRNDSSKPFLYQLTDEGRKRLPVS
ncbi:MAG: winged helix-turn-helix transcriptional regulator [Nitrososphaerota archaeon]|nr:winged helix-turn-helix transcriptional regulator [Nitrososphaerota archaeon]